MRMGVTYLDQRNLPMAMRELVKASELDPENAEIDMMIGLVYQARGDLPKAEEHLRRAIARSRITPTRGTTSASYSRSA